MPGVCSRCLREVYFAEEKLALGKVWHTFCFSCRNCRKLLDSCTVATHSGELYCRNCYARQFTPSVHPAPSPHSTQLDVTSDRKISRNSLSVDELPTTVGGHSFPEYQCCCCHGEDLSQAEKPSETKDIRSHKRHLRGAGEEEDAEDLDLAEVPRHSSETESSNLGLVTSITTLCNLHSSPTAVTAWYNRQHSASQSSVGGSSCTRKRLTRPVSSPSRVAVQLQSRQRHQSQHRGETKEARPKDTPTEHKEEQLSQSQQQLRSRDQHRLESQKQNSLQSQQQQQLEPSDKEFEQSQGQSQQHCQRSDQGHQQLETRQQTHQQKHIKNQNPLLPSQQRHRHPQRLQERIHNINSKPGKSVARSDSPLRHLGSRNCVNIESFGQKSSFRSVIRELAGRRVSGCREEDEEDNSCASGGCYNARMSSERCCGNYCANDSNYGNSNTDEDGYDPCYVAEDNRDSEKNRDVEGYDYDRSSCCRSETSNGVRSRAKNSYPENEERTCNGYDTRGGGGSPSSEAGRSSHAGRCGCGGSSYANGANCKKVYPSSPGKEIEPCSATEEEPIANSRTSNCNSPKETQGGCCSPAGRRPTCKKPARSCCPPCKSKPPGCGGGGCCGGGCRGGCGKPGQMCMPLRSCSTPCALRGCRPQGSPCTAPRERAPISSCCESSGAPKQPNYGDGGSPCCRAQIPQRQTTDEDCSSPREYNEYSSPGTKPSGCECLGGGLDCQRCGRKVYQAEMQIASGVPYHNICFSCVCCRKPLESLTYQENCGEIYCKQCYVRNFGPQGYGYGAGAGVLQTPL